MDIFHMTDIISLLGLPFPAHGRSSYYVQCPCCDDNARQRHLNINLKKRFSAAQSAESPVGCLICIRYIPESLVTKYAKNW